MANTKNTAVAMLSAGLPKAKPEPEQQRAADQEGGSTASPPTQPTDTQAKLDPSAAPATAAAGGGPVGETTAYERQTVFLTPELRTWLKRTVRNLDSDTLKLSDVGRLALRRLRADIDNGLDLEALLVQQLQEETQLAPGRLRRSGSSS